MQKCKMGLHYKVIAVFIEEDVPWTRLFQIYFCLVYNKVSRSGNLLKGAHLVHTANRSENENNINDAHDFSYWHHYCNYYLYCRKEMENSLAF